MKQPFIIYLLFILVLTSCGNNASNSTASNESASDSTQSDVDINPTQKDSSRRSNPNTVTDVKILYGTDRKVIINKPGSVKFGSLPANPGLPYYTVGYTVISIPPNHKEGNIETPSIWKLEFKEDTLKHMVQQETKRLSNKDFNALLKSAENGQSAFVFIHGFNNSFEDAAFRTAQLAYDIHLPVTPIMFSWSSNGTVRDYSGDEDKVKLAIPAFEDFLKRIATEGNFSRIHLIGHSMGNRLVADALTDLRFDKTNLKIDQIVMAAPDVYADDFKLRNAEALTQKAQHVTIYSARNDWALKVSQNLHHTFRLGEIGMPPPTYVFNKIDIIDAVNEKTDFLGHDRFARSATIISDMDLLLKTGMNAAQRNIPKKMIGSYLYYYFK